MSERESAHVQACREANRLDHAAKTTYPDKEAEVARATAYERAMTQIKDYEAQAARARERSVGEHRNAEAARSQVAEIEAKLNALPNDVQSVRMLGDREALRAYLRAI